MGAVALILLVFASYPWLDRPARDADLLALVQPLNVEDLLPPGTHSRLPQGERCDHRIDRHRGWALDLGSQRLVVREEA